VLYIICYICYICIKPTISIWHTPIKPTKTPGGEEYRCVGRELSGDGEDALGVQVGVICITIIDTIILTNYTNNAYLFDTYTGR
jgi:hypothetical protein